MTEKSVLNRSLYGWGSYRPEWLQFLHKPRWLVAWLCLATAATSISDKGVYSSAVDTLSRRYQLSNLQIGLLSSSYDVSSCFVILALCKYGDRWHKGFWIASGYLLYALGCVIFTIPQYISPVPETAGWVNSLANQSSRVHFCSPLLNGSANQNEDCDINGGNFHLKLDYLLLLLGKIVSAAGATPILVIGLTYVDENVSQRSSPLYLSIVFAVGGAFIAVGFIIGGQLMKINADFYRINSSDFGLHLGHFEWYGAWWLGYLIAAAMSVISAVFLLGYSRELPNKSKHRSKDLMETHELMPADSSTTEKEDCESESRKTINDLLLNPVFCFSVLRNGLRLMLISGFIIFLPLYLKSSYGLSQPVAAMVAGLIFIAPVVLGSCISGLLIRNFSMRVRAILVLQHIVGGIGGLSTLAILAYCKSQPFADTDLISHAVNISGCSAGCNCNLNDFSPVCHTKLGIQFSSPCAAGCQGIENGLYTNCSCLVNLGGSSVEEATLTSGLCVPEDCFQKMIIFCVFFAIACFCGGMNSMPTNQAILRSVNYDQRTLAIGLQLFALKIIGLVPGPLIFGRLFDSSCLRWAYVCGEQTSCLHYDAGALALKMVFLGLCISFLAATCMICSLLLYRPPGGKSCWQFIQTFFKSCF